MTQLLVLFCALFFAWMGTMGIRHPSRLLRPFGIQATSAPARNEIRAVYGGFGLAMAAMLAGGLMWSKYLTGITLALGLAMAGMGLGRIVSAMLDGEFGRLPMIYLGIEAALATALLTVFCDTL